CRPRSRRRWRCGPRGGSRSAGPPGRAVRPEPWGWSRDRTLPKRTGLGYIGLVAEPSVFAMVLAGGEGKRLAPLTADRAKPAVPFGGTYRLVDFVLSNLVNAGYVKIVVLTQYKSHSLDRHIAQTWRFSANLQNYVATVPAQMRRGPYWFAGSADAIFQNFNLVYDER